MNQLSKFAFSFLFISALHSTTLATYSYLNYETGLERVADRMESLADKTLSNNRESFVAYTTEAGIWKTQSDATWTSGFVAGLFWNLYQATGETKWLTRARHWTEGLRSRATATDNDTGFQIMCSFGLGRELFKEKQNDYDSVIKTAAERVQLQRFNPTMGVYRSWDAGIANPNTLPFEVNIDQMMNLELNLWYGTHFEEQLHLDSAISHADKTWENNVRENGGTYHVVAYNPDGSPDYKRTHQGYHRDSTWSRGQAWAIYGYVMIYRYTGQKRFLRRSISTLDYFLSEMAKDRSDFIPYSDFDAPLDSRNPRDTSAAAIVASALMELYIQTGNESHLIQGKEILNSLMSPTYLSSANNYDSVLLAGSEKWGLKEVGTIFGDYYFLEALIRMNAIDQEQLAYGKNATYTGPSLGWVNTKHLPWAWSYSLNRYIYLHQPQTPSSGTWIYLPKPKDFQPE